ncbi:hypothetical protein KIS1582_1564 [Cytobacillus firmus]|uniref:Uncharacterized protein n=1 Tax=Cytobacillus firmus TaxID=1399 RepID=A0A800MY60_CYTFI|nr:hypothetical protein KIS1582_1564 [Cytobacillus firmus]
MINSWGEHVDSELEFEKNFQGGKVMRKSGLFPEKATGSFFG